MPNIDQETDKIADFQIVQVSEVNSNNAMESGGLRRCMGNIEIKGGQIKVVATDRIKHQFDVWHLSKTITKKLTEKAKKKNCGELSPRIK